MKYRFILMEGMDNSGKTTLSEVVQNCGYTLFKSSNEISSGVDLEEAIQHDWRFLLDFIYQTCDYIVFDRSFITQWAYSMKLRQDNILRHYHTFDIYNAIFQRYCDQMMHDTLIIYCKRGDYRGTDDAKVDMNIGNAVQRRFDYFFRTIGQDLSILTCDFEDGIEGNKLKILRKLGVL